MKELPVTIRRSIELLGLFALGMAIVAGKMVVMPLLTAVYISLVLLPCFRFFKKRKIPETISIALSLLIMFITIGLIIWFISSQVGRLLEDLPQIQKNIMIHLNDLSDWIND